MTMSFNPLAAVDSAKITDQGLPPLENGEYIIELTDFKFTGQNKYLVAEFKVDSVLSGDNASPVGTQSSWVRDMVTQGWENYLKTWLLKALGVNTGNPEEVAQWAPYLSRMAVIAVTKVAQELVPGHKVGPTAAEGGFIGRKMRLIVSQGKTNAKGKYYPNTVYLQLAA